VPVSDGLGGALGLKVFERVERALVESNWCLYQSNSDLLNVFARYRENLYNHLRTPEVIRVVSDRLQAGSIIRISLKKELGHIEISLEVVGANGEDIVFQEKENLKRDDLDLVVETLQTWLDIYSKTIPYDGMVTGVVGDQITIDISKNQIAKLGQPFTVKRLFDIKKHPLLKKIVSWETKSIADGKIFNISDDQALGVVRLYRSDNSIKVGDWVRLEPIKDEKADEEISYAETKDSFGKLGVVSAYLNLGTQEMAVSDSSSRRMRGFSVGFSGEVEAWVTRNWFGYFELGRSLGTLKKSSGSFDSSSSSYQRSALSFGGGYKYLPLGFFYGPQIDIKLGWANHGYIADFNSVDRVGEFAISGFALGVQTNFPVGRLYRGVIGAELLPFPRFSDEDGAYGSARSTSWLQLTFGAKYQYNQTLTLDALIEMTNSKSSLKGDAKSVSMGENILKVGASHNF
jgi:hypothetical protein